MAYLIRRTGDPEVAADLTAEVFAAALVAAPRYRQQSPTATPWLFAIAQNKLTESLRRGRVEARARRRLGIRDPVCFDDEQLDRVVALASVEMPASELLASLPAEQREAVRLRIVEELSYPQIAARLQTSPLVVRKRVSRGLARLRKTIEEGR